jgi:uncharacterized protein
VRRINFGAKAERWMRSRLTLPRLRASTNSMEKSAAGRLQLCWPTQSGLGIDCGLHARLLPAVYNGTKAFLDSFSYALREELKATNVTVTCLMPGATETEFFRRAEMLDTKVGASTGGRRKNNH